MNYEANTTLWRRGALVLHDKDRKKPDMLMVVQHYDRETGQCITRYLHPDYLPGMRGRFSNDVRVLHDPARFGVQVEGAE